MEPVAQTIERHQRPDVDNQPGMLDLPRLDDQQSLRNLIAEDLQSREDISMEMVALLLRRNTADTATTSSGTRNGASGFLLDSTDGDKKSQNQKATYLQPWKKDIVQSFWRWIIKKRGATSEQPKVVYSHKRREILKQVLLFHLVPVCINFALFGLYVRRVLWVPSWPTTNMLNILQFAAKVHETLMIASLASVLLHHIRYRLLSTSQGVPLGLLTSPFRLLDLTYLWSQEFIAACSSEKGTYRVISIIIHVYLFIVAAMLGPASAISMLPRLKDWELANAIAKAPFDGVGLETYIGGRLSDIYPQRITETFISEACDYGNFSQPQTNTCPRYGLEDILNHLIPDLEIIDVDLVFQEFNVTVQKIAIPALPSRTISGNCLVQNFGNHQAGVDSTTPPDVTISLTQFLVAYYSLYWTVVSEKNLWFTDSTRPAKLNLYPGQLQPRQSPSSWKQPYVSSLCSIQRASKTDESRVLSFDLDPCFDLGCESKHTVDLDSKFLPTAFSDTGMGFLDVSKLRIMPSFTPSAGFIYTQSANTILCLIKANWIDLTITAFVPSDSPANLGWTWREPQSGWLFTNGEDWFNESYPSQILHSNPEWLSALDSGSGARDHSFFERLRRACLDLAPESHNAISPEKRFSTRCMPFGLSLGITEGLSKVPYHFGAHILEIPDDFSSGAGPSLTLSRWTSTRPGVNMADWGWTSATLSPSEIRETSTRLDFVVSGGLYGYGFHGVTIILAFVVLFLYVATVFVHIVVMSLGTRWSSRAWKTLGEFLVLAIRSPTPPVLENTGGGVEGSSTWKARVSIQELQGGKTVGMAVEEPGLSGTTNGSISRVRPDWKYS